MEGFFSVLNVILFNVIIPLLVLSLLIFIHELGHYLAARFMKTEVKEFAIGMGPRIFSFKKNKIIYSIRAIPMGGAVTMVGEDEDSESENALFKKPVWKRFIIMVAGSFMNILLGFVIMAVIVSGQSDKGYPSTQILNFQSGISTSNNIGGLETGDEIIKINNKKINIYQDLAYALIREGKDPVDITVMRKGEKVLVKGVQFPTEVEEGITYGIVDFYVAPLAKNLPTVVSQTFFQSLSTIDMVWTSFFDLITGKFGIEEMSGPVGVTQAIGDSARAVTEGKNNSRGFLFLIALITMNLGVVNLLPLPALDGGRIVFLVIEFIRRKPIKPEYEGYIHLAGFALLILFMIFVTYKDIMKLIVG